jgi:hypothetical protein
VAGEGGWIFLQSVLKQLCLTSKEKGRIMKKLFLAALLSLFTATSANADMAFVNELHYDNGGADVGEFVEFAIESGADLTQVLVEAINGNGGTSYANLAGTGLTAGATGLNFGGTSYDLFVWTIPGLQNGAPDGVAITTSMGVQDFISYEGAITSATSSNGTALGASTDIGVTQGGGNVAGNSLGIDATGAWVAFTNDTSGQANFEPAAIPEPSSLALLGLIGCASVVRRRR